MLVVFLAFLPMCFYFVGIQIERLQSENQELRTQLATLQKTTGH